MNLHQLLLALNAAYDDRGTIARHIAIDATNPRWGGVIGLVTAPIENPDPLAVYILTAIMAEAYARRLPENYRAPSLDAETLRALMAPLYAGQERLGQTLATLAAEIPAAAPAPTFRLRVAVSFSEDVDYTGTSREECLAQVRQMLEERGPSGIDGIGYYRDRSEKIYISQEGFGRVTKATRFALCYRAHDEDEPQEIEENEPFTRIVDLFMDAIANDGRHWSSDEPTKARKGKGRK